MISMQGVPSVLIAKNQSWVRQQAQSLARRLPANVERADLIQVGLIAVAQAAVCFQWPEDRESDQAQQDFVRYARMRVKGAMLDELRQMDFLSRGERRKLKAVEIARERLRSTQGQEPGLSELAGLTGLEIHEISELMRADQLGRSQVVADEAGEAVGMARFLPASAGDEVEARVDTAIVLRRLERFFAALPERERMVIDAYLGIGLTPSELARSLNVTPSRVSQIYHAVVQRAAHHVQMDLTHEPRQRAMDKLDADAAPSLEELVRQREQDLTQGSQAGWGEIIEHVLLPPSAAQALEPDGGYVHVDANTRWG